MKTNIKMLAMLGIALLAIDAYAAKSNFQFYQSVHKDFGDVACKITYYRKDIDNFGSCYVYPITTPEYTLTLGQILPIEIDAERAWSGVGLGAISNECIPLIKSISCRFTNDPSYTYDTVDIEHFGYRGGNHGVTITNEIDWTQNPAKNLKKIKYTDMF